mgnify:CR=1 FL=1|tara:strand:+ start:1968 stop:2399 length:432 start_codon:yes stop_codon:yes gene_type:complete
MKCVLIRSKNIKLKSYEKKLEFPEGLIAVVGIEKEDGESQVEKIVKTIKKTAIFENENGKIKIPPKENTKILVLPNFTLTGKIKKGKTPDFSNCMNRTESKVIFESICKKLKIEKFNVFPGFFGELMELENTIDGPVIYSFEV